jgi:hypothetical protein
LPLSLEERAFARVSKDARPQSGRRPFETAALRPPQGDGTSKTPRKRKAFRYAFGKARHSANWEIAMLTDADIQSHAARIRDDGYTVIERAASPELVEGLKAAVLRIESEHNLAPARTSFEGFKTLRINNLLT